MKKIIYIALASTLAFTGCKSDFLDLKPASYSEDNLFSDIALSEAFVNSLYLSIPLDVANYPLNLNAASDEAKTTNPIARANYITQGNYDATTNTLSTWNGSYQAIRNANLFLKNYEQLPAGDERDRLKGEVLFMRAFYYQTLLKQYGGKGLGIPLILHPQNINEDIYVDRASYEQTVEMIVKDLDEATDLLPIPNKTAAARASKGAAMALKVRVLMYAASPMNNPTNDRQKWQRVADAAKVLIEKDYYTLNDNYEKLFLEKNNELIFYKLYTNGPGNYSLLDFNIQPPTTGGRGSSAPSQQAVDAYEVVTMESGIKTATSFNWSNPEHASAPYQNRDPRFYASVLYDEAEWSDGKGGKRSLDLKDNGIDRTMRPENATKTGYYLRKFMDFDFFPKFQRTGDARSFSPVIEIRYAEVLLNYAEALIKLGEHNEALKYINMIRDRKSVKMPPIPLGQLTWERYVNERRVELAFEQHRFWDVRRWGIAKEKSKELWGISIKVKDGGKIYTPVLIENRVYETKMDIFPIPQGEIDKYRSVIPSFEQNPEWD
ncbi:MULTISPECIES: RagB/SusD family nutrient uptake outer membrane protein [Sphingobacterium]|uniref:RagB/SusD family nutrient uptake outer membrane protein n=1 Tax=Sphingobacterium TaxID=28453 RepID=UPI0013DD556B|nr:MULTISPECIES: RagB/SusD family nutrient uptake outer membrane protein [unclassified Sphingobacterium]